jgi:hypothetical protein
VWNGSSWVNAKSAKVWNGSSWVNFLSSVNIEDASEIAVDSGFEYASATATYSLFNNGSAETSASEFASGQSTINPLVGQWLTGGLASDFSVRANDLSSYGLITGTFNEWLSLSDSHQWSTTVTVYGYGGLDSAFLSMYVEIAYTRDLSTIIDSANITLQATAQVN